MSLLPASNRGFSITAIDQAMDQPDLLYQMDGESPDAYLCFQIFTRMGPARTISKTVFQYRKTKGLLPPEAVYETGHKNPGWVFDWINRFHWRTRVKAYDDWQVRLQAIKIAGWSEVVRDNAWSDYDRIRGILHQFIDQLDGQSLEPAEIRELTRAANEVDALGRRAAGLPDRIVESNIQQRNVNVTVTPEDFIRLNQQASEELDEWQNSRRNSDPSADGDYTILGLDGGEETP